MVTLEQVLNEIDYLLFVSKQITLAEKNAYLDRLYSELHPVSPQQLHDELVARYLAAQDAARPKVPGTGSGGGDGTNGDNGDPIDDPRLEDPYVGVLEMPIVFGVAGLASVAARLAPYLIRVGVGLGIPLRLWRTMPPGITNAVALAAAALGPEAADEFQDGLASLLQLGDDNASVIEIHGTEAELLQLQGGGGMGGLTLVPGLGNLPPGVWIVKQWRAPKIGGVQFYKFSNGLIAVQKLDGTWKVYRPRRPIVLYPGVGNNRRSIMRAAHVVRQEVKAWKSMEKFFGMQRRRALPAPKRGRAVVIEHGSGSVVTD